MRCYNCLNSKWQKSEKDYECEMMPQCLMEDVEKREKYKELGIQVGSKILFKGEKRYWTVVARDERFLICVRKQKEWYYTICDLFDCIRGADDHYGYYDYENMCEEQAEIALAQFHLSDYTTIDKLDVSDKAKKWYRENYLVDTDKLTEEQKETLNSMWDEVPNLNISYRNWVELEIEKIK